MNKNTENIAVTANESKKTIGRSVAVNGVHAVDVELKKSSNLQDPIVDLNIKVNNPIGRLWLALKRLWKSQNTVVALRFTIPLIVLPIAIYVGWRLWQGRGVSVPMSKLGIIHMVKIGGLDRDILVLPSSDVYILSYDTGFEYAHRLTEKPVVVIGTYSHLTNELSVGDVVAYNPADIVPSPSMPYDKPTTWQTILRFIDQFR